MDHATATEVRIATPDDDVRFTTFVRSFLSDNGYPFIMVRSDPDVSGGGGGALKRVMFEEEAINRRFREQWGVQAFARGRMRGNA